MGTDRVLDLTFGHGENAVHLIVEFYVQGNVILTDSNYKILMVLRNQRIDAESRVAVGEVYQADSVAGGRMGLLASSITKYVQKYFAFIFKVHFFLMCHFFSS